MVVWYTEMSEETSPFRRRWGSNASAAHRYRPASLVAASDNDMFSKCTGDAGGGGGGGGAEMKHLGVNFKQLLRDPVGLDAFTKFLRHEHSEENIEFWQECERYRRGGGDAALARDIYETYLRERADACLPSPDDDRCKTVNVDAKVRQDIERRLQQAPQDLFDKAQEQIYRLMEFDCYQRYLKSTFHSNLVLNALGLPSPRAVANNKVQKSRSNASESGRGRSMLSRLLPRDSNSTPEPQATDTRRPSSSSLCENLKDLCKVILPDSKSATIQRTGDKSVRDTVDHLLHIRGICCRDYDVVVRGDSKAVDVSRPMSELAGREVEIRRRVVFKLTVTRRLAPNRTQRTTDAHPCKCLLQVRTAPDKTLESVLQSVLRRYGLTETKVEITLDDRPVAVDTLVGKLEGSHVEVREVHSPASLDEITNRVFAEVLSDKSQHTDYSVKSENGSSEHSSGAVLARLCPGTALHVAPTPLASAEQQRRRSPVEGACGLPCAAVPPVPAARTSITRPPRPTVRTSLGKTSAAPAAGSPSAPQSSESPRPPPPLPPKPKVQPARPSNWGHATETYLDRSASSFV